MSGTAQDEGNLRLVGRESGRPGAFTGPATRQRLAGSHVLEALAGFAERQRDAASAAPAPARPRRERVLEVSLPKAWPGFDKAQMACTRQATAMAADQGPLDEAAFRP